MRRKSVLRRLVTVETAPSPPPAPPSQSKELHVLVRVWLPDRPGASGLVASRIGSVGADIVGVDVAGTRRWRRGRRVRSRDSRRRPPRPHGERDRARRRRLGGGGATGRHLPGPAPRRPRVGGRALRDRVDRRPAPGPHRARASRVPRRLGGARARRGPPRAGGDGAPEVAKLVALDAGTAASPLVADGAAGPEDLAVARLPVHEAAILVGRDGHVFRRRERAQLMVLAGVADRAWTLLADRAANRRSSSAINRRLLTPEGGLSPRRWW